MTLTVPALRERREDIPGLVRDQIERFRTQLGSPVEGIAPEALDALVGYDWPGNVRELINVVERAVLLCQEEEIGLPDLPVLGPQRGIHALPADAAGDGLPLGLGDDLFRETLPLAREELVERFERIYLERALRACGGRIGETARNVGLSERALFGKMRRYGLRKEDFRATLGREPS
jgi:DNA-binding NtrC family response regulator